MSAPKRKSTLRMMQAISGAIPMKAPVKVVRDKNMLDMEKTLGGNFRCRTPKTNETRVSMASADPQILLRSVSLKNFASSCPG